MENTITKKNKSLKCGSAIKGLSTISLICTALGCISYFFYYEYEYINGKWVNLGLTFSFPRMISLISLLLTMAPIILLVLYIFKFHNKLKATVLVPIILGILGLKPIFNSLFGHSFYVSPLPYGIYRIRDLAILVCSILAVISALKGFNKKIFKHKVRKGVKYEFISINCRSGCRKLFDG